jgi:hypothetical protein
VWTIDDIDRTGDELEALLNRNGITVANGSRLQEALTFPRHVQYVRQGAADIGTHDDRAQWREMAGIYDLGKRLLVAEKTAPRKFEWLLPWLTRFSSLRGQLAQTSNTIQGDQDSDIMFELLVALCLLPEIDKLMPDIGLGDNPDLLFDYNSQRWGVACKRMYSRLPSRFQKTVTKAISQIEVSSAERGLIFVNVVNLVDHDRFYSMTDDGQYRAMSVERMMRELEAEEQRISDEIVGVTDDELSAEFRKKKAMPGVVHYLGTTCLVGNSESLTLKTIQHAFSRGRVNELLHVFQDGLNSTSADYRPGAYATHLAQREH